MLLVEDDAVTAEFILLGMRQAGFIVDHRTNGHEATGLALTEKYDVGVVDIMLPGRDGLSLVNEIRRKNINFPVLILSAKHSVDDRVSGLHAGGDDYLVKPFAFVELLARVQALLRRGQTLIEPNRLQVGALVIDLLTRRVMRGEDEISLQPRELMLLAYFARHPGRVLSKTMILQHVWDYEFDPKTNVVDVLVCRLRNKLEIDGLPSEIRTIRGVGYVLEIQ